MQVPSCLTALLVLAYVGASESTAVQSPVAKVVTLITEMKATAEKEAEADQVNYDKFSCWALTNEKEKKAAIAANEANVQTQETFIEAGAGNSARLSTEIDGLKGDIEEAQAALDAGNAQREKESESFQAEEADMKETIGLLKQAVSKLQAVQLMQKKGHAVPKEQQGEVLLQIKTVAKSVRRHPHFNDKMQRDLFDILGSLQNVARKEAGRQGSTMAAGALLGEVFLPKKGMDEDSLLQSLLKEDAAPNKLKGAAAGAKSYNSKSGAIFGILGEMQDEFERDLGSAQKEDFNALVQFQNLHAAKSGELAASNTQKENKEGELAELLSKVAESKESLSASNDALEADNTFLTNLIKNRATEDKEFKARSATRSDEIKALGETITILTDDAARAMFGKTMSFVQVSAATSTSMERAQNMASKKAMKRLMDIGKKHHNMALVGLAVRVRLDAFDAVKKSLGKQLAIMQAQQSAEYKKWEGCKKDIDTQEDTIKDKQETQNDLNEKHQDLQNTIEQLKAGIAQLKEDVASNNVELKKAGEARKEENLLFQSSVSDQRATKGILTMAQNKLKAFYESKSFVQTGAQQPATDSYEKSGGAGGVMQLLAKIILDAEVEEKELTVAEADAQLAYADVVKDTTNSIEVANEAILEKKGQEAKARGEQSDTAADQIGNDKEIEGVQKLLMGTHQECDFLLKFFDVRQKARSEEMDAIGEATAILSGAKFS